MSPQNLIGKKVKYRPAYHTDMVTSTVVSAEELFSKAGKTVFLGLENGSTVDMGNCYFFEPISDIA